MRALVPGRDPRDRAIAALAIPALAALAADPLYSLVDTAFVGNLGTPQLGALAVGTAAFTAAFWLFSFLAYGVTPKVGRAVGAGDVAGASRVGSQALLLAAAIGSVVTVAGIVLAAPVVRLLGAGPEVALYAEPYLRIRMLSAIPVLVAQVGHGWLRGTQDTKTPMYIVTAGAALNVVLDYVMIYPLGLGIEGAAWATVIGQTGAAAAFIVVLVARMEGATWRPERALQQSLLRVGADLSVRTGSLLAGLTFTTAMAARMGQVELASWQIAMQLFLFLALSLDSVAIAAQALVAKHLGAATPAAAADLGRRLMYLGLLLGVALMIAMFASARPLASVFTRDAEVIAAASGLLLWLALVQPLAGAAFTLDGILIGASDTRFLAASMAGSSVLFVAISWASLQLAWGTVGLAVGATVWLLARVSTTGLRWWGERWAVT